MSVLSEDEHDVEINTLETRTIEGALRWFDHVKGYGFIIPQDGSGDILLHNDVLRNFGSKRLKPGMQISCEIMKSPKGMLATRILDVLEDAQNISSEIMNDNHPESFRETIKEEDLKVAIVKWYDERKGYGFAVTHDDHGDVMLSRHILRQCGIRNILPGDKLRITIEHTERGLLAEYIEYC